MSRVRGANTKPEIAVRQLVWSLGYRYRLHARELPGRPDLIFRKLKKAIFVHGCFWHQHLGCRRASIPKSRPDFWLPKLAKNQERDRTTMLALRRDGWATLVVWECELRDGAKVLAKVRRFLKKTAAPSAQS